MNIRIAQKLAQEAHDLDMQGRYSDAEAVTQKLARYAQIAAAESGIASDPLALAGLEHNLTMVREAMSSLGRGEVVAPFIEQIFEVINPEREALAADPWTQLTRIAELIQEAKDPTEAMLQEKIDKAEAEGTEWAAEFYRGLFEAYRKRDAEALDPLMKSYRKEVDQAKSPMLKESAQRYLREIEDLKQRIIELQQTQSTPDSDPAPTNQADGAAPSTDFQPYNPFDDPNQPSIAGDGATPDPQTPAGTLPTPASQVPAQSVGDANPDSGGDPASSVTMSGPMDSQIVEEYFGGDTSLYLEFKQALHDIVVQFKEKRGRLPTPAEINSLRKSDGPLLKKFTRNQRASIKEALKHVFDGLHEEQLEGKGGGAFSEWIGSLDAAPEVSDSPDLPQDSGVELEDPLDPSADSPAPPEGTPLRTDEDSSPETESVDEASQPRSEQEAVLGPSDATRVMGLIPDEPHEEFDGATDFSEEGGEAPVQPEAVPDPYDAGIPGAEEYAVEIPEDEQSGRPAASPVDELGTPSREEAPQGVSVEDPLAPAGGNAGPTLAEEWARLMADDPAESTEIPAQPDKAFQPTQPFDGSTTGTSPSATGSSPSRKKQQNTSGKSNSQTQSTPQPAPKTQSTPQPAPQTQSTPQPAPKTQSTPQPAPKTQSTPQPDPQTQSSPQPATQTQSTPQPDPQTQSTPQPAPKSTPQPAPKTQSTPQVDPQGASAPKPAPQAASASDSEEDFESILNREFGGDPAQPVSSDDSEQGEGDTLMDRFRGWMGQKKDDFSAGMGARALPTVVSDEAKANNDAALQLIRELQAAMQHVEGLRWRVRAPVKVLMNQLMNVVSNELGATLDVDWEEAAKQYVGYGIEHGEEAMEHALANAHPRTKSVPPEAFAQLVRSKWRAMHSA
jgi:hypothetical protein